MLQQVLALILAVSSMGNALPSHKIMGHISSYAERTFQVTDIVLPEDEHEVTFAVKQLNLDIIDDILWDVSNPKSSHYGNHRTREEVNEITRNAEGRQAVRAYLQSIGATIVQERRDGHYITARASIGIWERELDTKFHQFSNEQGATVIRAKSYSLPLHIADHVSYVFQTTEFPSQLNHPKQYIRKNKPAESDNYVIPSFLWSHYNIDDRDGKNYSSQAIFASLGQSMSPSNLKSFLTDSGSIVQAIYSDVGGHVDDQTCIDAPDNCTESSLDIQYIMSTAQNIPTTYYYFADEQSSINWANWATEVADLSDPPKVFSISYSSYEVEVDSADKETFSTEVKQLGVMGVTILSAAGDDGVAGFLVRDDSSFCGYYAQFPASNPYVTAVGGTMGPESGYDEVAAQTDNLKISCSITTGGGTSNYYARPSFQNSYVNDYINLVSGTSYAPATSESSNYNISGRAYPDISALAHNYYIYDGSYSFPLDGTSASTPFIAGLVSLINAGRLANNNSTLGWFNPALYEYSSNYVIDITSGKNNCTEGVCCSEGFYATKGWDPVTGLGALDYSKLYKTFVSGSSSSSNSNSLSDGEIAGIVIGSVAGAVLLGVVIFFAGKSFFAAGASSTAATTAAPSVTLSPMAGSQV